MDLPKLMAYLPRLVSDHCLGIWVSTDSGAITWKAESLSQILHDSLPGCSIEPLRLGVQWPRRPGVARRRGGALVR